MENVKDHLNYFSYSALPVGIAETDWPLIVYYELLIGMYYKRRLIRREKKRKIISNARNASRRRTRFDCYRDARACVL